MNKPDDVSQEAWDAADKWALKAYSTDTETWFDVRDIIARAIMAARAEALEEAASLANIKALKHQDIADSQDAGMTDSDRYQHDMIGDVLDELANQIRARK